MGMSKRTSIYLACLFIGAGVLFLFFNLIPGLGGKAWPLIFFILAAGFILPWFLWSEVRRGLAGLFVPGCILATLGLIFTYNVLSRDWASWAYAWILVNTGLGLGLLLGARAGRWGRAPEIVGTVFIVASLALFALFAALFGGAILKIIGPLVVVGLGGMLLWQALHKPGQDA